MRWRQLIILALAFAAGTAVAGLFGAANLGVALAVGAIAFGFALVAVMLADPPRSPPPRQR